MNKDAVPPADVAALRREYTRSGIRKGDLDADPFLQFRHWFGDAMAAGLVEPNAMVLSTTDGHRPSSRSVLLKAYDGRGFVFFTNDESRKARDIAANASVSLLFPWYALERQVGILGRAEKVSSAEALAYFASRPHGSRLGAWVSSQSAVIASRRLLEMKWQEVKQKFADGEIPLPSFWGGFRVVPSEIEFWQGRENRLHDRLRYSRATDGWLLERLAP
ncbi:MAG: pyridoxamine 5'-phosphate oxidase [Chthoniobacterales bacterium]|nr:pyridoxamine 5'-phosphate oxidase [Chthoniobacterales bacterium]